MKKEIFEGIAQGIKEMQAHRAGKKVAVKIHIPDSVDVASVRKKLNMTQAEFCEMFGFPPRTLKSWERGERKPEGAARVLLRMISKDAKAVVNLAN